MRFHLLLFTLILSLPGLSQQERDTVLKRCPVAITDTVSVNNFFIEALPATLKVYRVKGKLTIQVQQKDQFFTIFFHSKRLKNGSYDIAIGSRGGSEVEATYSFKSGEQVSYINVANGKLDASYDKEKKLWTVKVNGMIANLVDRSVTYYRAKANLVLK
ncbi:MAG: hypothetical protein JNM19_15690 [Chitinophagaceae bacterium]|nr:hypothetical protein [Chitinophagaceae bacterium]